VCRGFAPAGGGAKNSASLTACQQHCNTFFFVEHN